MTSHNMPHDAAEGATPAEMTEQPRGGTWGTIQIARARKVPLAIVWPDGRVDDSRVPR